MRTTLTTLALAIALVAVPASAATITLTPTTVNVTKGQTFTVVVNANGEGTRIYTVKSIVTYPPALLEATTMVIDAAWPLTPPGNAINNPGGSLTYTAGFTGGFTDAKKFGTITFRAKESGNATIAVASGSAAYDAQSANKVAGAQGASAVTIAAVVTPVPTVQPVAQTQTPTGNVAQTRARPSQTAAVATVATATATDTPSTESTADSQVAATGILGNNIVLALLALLAVGIAGGTWWYFNRRRV